MITFLNAVRRIGADYEVLDNGIVFFVPPGATLRGIDLETDTHPGFMTDWQQPFTLVLTQCEGTSVVHETVYEETTCPWAPCARRWRPGATPNASGRSTPSWTGSASPIWPTWPPTASRAGRPSGWRWPGRWWRSVPAAAPTTTRCCSSSTSPPTTSTSTRSPGWRIASPRTAVG